MGKRRRARETALQLLYQEDLLRREGESPDPAGSGPASSAAGGPAGPLGEEMDAYTAELVEGTLNRREEIDREIVRWSEHWTLDRMSVIDRNILRFAAYELLFRGDIPPSVIINEAVEIAKKFGSAESSVFINGILDRIRREHEREP